MAESSKALSKAQLRWIEEYLVDGNGKAAAIRAGFSSRGADALAKKYLANPAVRACASNLQKALLTPVAPSLADVSQGMRQAIDLARQQSDAPAMLSAMRELAQLHGFSPIESNEVVADSQEAPAWKFRWMDDAELVGVMNINGVHGDDSSPVVSTRLDVIGRDAEDDIV
jgi:hypothetical protein